MKFEPPFNLSEYLQHFGARTVELLMSHDFWQMGFIWVGLGLVCLGLASGWFRLCLGLVDSLQSLFNFSLVNGVSEIYFKIDR